VDDDVNEIVDDLASRQTSIGGLSSGFGTVRHAASSLRRRPTTGPALPRVDSSHEEETEPESTSIGARAEGMDDDQQADADEVDDICDEEVGPDEEVEEDDGDVSDAESFTLKDRQEAINETHPFGIRIWKPALYKKNRSVQKTAEGDIHSAPGGRVNKWLVFFNLVWTICFGWWLGLIAFTGAVVCFIFAAAPSAVEYGRVLWQDICSTLVGSLCVSSKMKPMLTKMKEKAEALRNMSSGKAEIWRTAGSSSVHRATGPLWAVEGKVSIRLPPKLIVCWVELAVEVTVILTAQDC